MNQAQPVYLLLTYGKQTGGKSPMPETQPLSKVKIHTSATALLIECLEDFPGQSMSVNF